MLLKWSFALSFAINSILIKAIFDDEPEGTCLLQKRAVVTSGLLSSKYFNEASSEATLKLPRDSSERLLYIGIMSAPENAKLRAKVRSSYLDKLRRGNANTRIRAEFLIGHVPQKGEEDDQGVILKDKQLKIELGLQDEAKLHGDIRRIPLPESYLNLPDKVLQFFQHGADMNYEFLLKIDDDQTLNVARAELWAETKNSSDLIYAGSYMWSKKISDSQLGRMHDFKPYFAGPCYLLSWGLAHQIVDVHDQHTGEFTSYGSSSEDVDMGQWVAWEKQLGGSVQYETLQGLLVAEPQLSWAKLAFERALHISSILSSVSSPKKGQII